VRRARRYLTPAARSRFTGGVAGIVQCDDTIFARDGQFELFDVLASIDKRLLARPGQHSETHPDDEASWQEFMDRYTAR